MLDLNYVVNDLENMLRRLIDANVEMKTVPGKKIGHVKADAGYIGQVLMNLVVNARDAMPQGGKLTIATSDVKLDENYTRCKPGVIPGDYVMLSVSDTGQESPTKSKPCCSRRSSQPSRRGGAPV